VRFSLLLFTASMIAIGLLGYQLNFGRAGQQINTHFFEEILKQRIAETPQKAQLYSMLGDLKYSQKAYDETVKAYEHSLSLSPDNPQVLNNLAWLYATCEDETLRNPERALSLARRAATLDASPHVLDTLAECYFINGDVDNAVRFAQRALDSATEKRDYYRSQLERFRKAEKEG